MALLRRANPGAADTSVTAPEAPVQLLSAVGTHSQKVCLGLQCAWKIEELFRDANNEHLGWTLAKTRIRKAARLGRLILIAALAYVLLVALGLKQVE